MHCNNGLNNKLVETLVENKVAEETGDLKYLQDSMYDFVKTLKDIILGEYSPEFFNKYVDEALKLHGSNLDEFLKIPKMGLELRQALNSIDDAIDISNQEFRDNLVLLLDKFQTSLDNMEYEARSPYEIAVKHGFKGTEEEWLANILSDTELLNNLKSGANSLTDYIDTIPNIVNDAINNTAIEGGVLADTFVTATAKTPTATARNQRDINSETVSVRDYKKASDPDDYLSVVRASEYANSLTRQGILSHITHPGCTLRFPKGVYDFSSITSDVKILCNVEQDGAEIVIPPNYAGTVFTLGKETAGDLLCTANINLPDTNKATGTAIVPGSKFVRLANLNACTIKFGRSDYFDIAYDFSPLGQAVVYCDIYLGQVAYTNKIINMIPESGGWVNANNIHKGNLRLGGDHVTGKYHLYMDGTASPIIGNNFFGMTLEGGGAEWVVYAKKAYRNNFIGTYIETQSPAKAITSASGVNLTSVNHGYKVNDMLLFHGATLPTGLFDLTPYYVTGVTTDTFSVAISRGGASVSFTNSGVGLFSTRQGQCLFDGDSASNNKFINTTYPPSVGLDFISTGQAQNNGDDSPVLSVKQVYRPNNAPMWRGSNTAFSAQDRPIFAAYPSDKNPVHDPYSWTTALSDKGLLFAHNATPARIYSSFGFPMWEKKGSPAYQLAPIVKADSYTTLPSPSSVAANDRLIITLTVTGATSSDFVSLSLSSALPAGVVIAWTRVNVANTVQVCFQNVTTGAIDLGGQQIKAACIKASV